MQGYLRGRSQAYFLVEGTAGGLVADYSHRHRCSVAAAATAAAGDGDGAGGEGFELLLVKRLVACSRQHAVPVRFAMMIGLVMVVPLVVNITAAAAAAAASVQGGVKMPCPVVGAKTVHACLCL
eukprot:evm.model.NODE_40945_length_18597_cov_30.767275.3